MSHKNRTSCQEGITKQQTGPNTGRTILQAPERVKEQAGKGSSELQQSSLERATEFIPW